MPAKKPIRYVVVWQGMLTDRFLLEFLPGGVPRWTKNESRAKLYADFDQVREAAKTAATTMRKQGISASVFMRPK